MRFRAAIIALIASAIPLSVLGEGLDASRDFTFKRVKVGERQSRAQGLVQIDPVEQARLLAALPKTSAPHQVPELPPIEGGDEAAKAPLGPVPQREAAFAWFWDSVPAGIDDVSGRFPLALATLTQGPGGKSVPTPRMQHMQELADEFGTELLKATVGTEVSPALALAVMAAESAGKADAVSHAGAQGLMQLIPATAERFGVTDSMDPVENIKGGVAYLDWLMKHFDRDPIMVIAAYNAGEGAVKANRGVPPYSETRDYVPKVLAAWTVAQGLCMTPPEVVSDPCVFRIISASN
jgi:hypothetical protein